MAEKVGYIGLGIMGRPMALNLLRAGYPVWVYARRTEALPPLTEAGATVCSSPADVARHAEVVFTNVSDTPDVEQIVLGDKGIIHGAKHGAVVVDNSTISPSATRSMANKLRNAGVEMLDAPVSGGEKGAIDGTLSIMAGGRTEAFERVLPLLQVLGKNVVHVGGNGAGQVTKACNQVVIAQTIAAVGEALILATASGVNPVKVREALLGGFAGSRVLEVHGQAAPEGYAHRPGDGARAGSCAARSSAGHSVHQCSGRLRRRRTGLYGPGHRAGTFVRHGNRSKKITVGPRLTAFQRGERTVVPVTGKELRQR